MNADRFLDLYERISEAPDAVARMQRFVLDLAVRGKLVAQDPGDEPASVLLRQIPAEKALLSKAGKLGRTKASPPAPVDSGDALPPGWAAVYGVDLFPTRSGNSKLIKGRLHAKPEDDLYPGFSAAGQDVWLDTWEHEGDAIVLSAVGARCGKAFFATGKWSAIANTHIIWLLTRAIEPAYAMLNLNDENFWVRSGGAQPFVKVKATLQRPFCLPPLAEQHRIVAKVDELMALCDRLEEARKTREETRDALTAASLARLTTTETPPEDLTAHAAFALDALPSLTARPDQIKPLRQTILNLAVRGKLVEQNPADEPASALLARIVEESRRLAAEKGIKRQKAALPPEHFDDAPDIPNCWERVDLQHLAYQITDGTHLTPKYKNEGRPFISAQNVKPFEFRREPHRFVSSEDFDKYRANRKLERGDILLTRVGAGIGEAATFDSDEEFAFYVSVCLIKIPQTLLISRYLTLWLNSPEGRESSASRTYGKGASQGNLNLGLIRTFQIPLPPLAEQHRIVAKVDALMALCDRLEAALTAADAARARLLDALLAEALEPAQAREAAA